MATSAIEKLRELIDELFLLDEPDLDFGLYRVMKARRDQVARFRNHELQSVVARALSDHKDIDRAAIQRELDAAIQSARALGVDEKQTPKVRELEAKLAAAEAQSLVADEVFAHLYAFFSRYYQSGDFHCRRQFRDGVYAIPYEGEEVKLFWANKDQYYIKTAQRHTSFEFVVASLRVRFEVVGGSEERDNSKSTRVFMLDESEPFAIDGSTLVVRFRHDVDGAAQPQEVHSQRVAEALAKRSDCAPWYNQLVSADDRGESLLTKRLRQFMRRETFDYFIHKDLRRFLRQELDTYLKTEMMRLDDIEHADAPRVDEYLSKLRVTRKLGNTIIDFVAQLEDFQKRLWLKKKFVIDHHWLVSMALVPRALWPEVIANDKQREAWLKQMAIDKIANDLSGEGYTVPLSEAFLARHSSLPIDTSLFSNDFTAKLLEAIGDTEAKSLGLLVHGENFQALQLLHERFAGKVKCIYIDPPYNTGGDGFAYKDNYPHSSWLSMMEDRVSAGRKLLQNNGSFWMSIDDNELVNARHVGDEVFGEQNLVACNVWQKRYSRENREAIGDSHEYVLTYVADRMAFKASRGLLPLTSKQLELYKNPDNDPRGEWQSVSLLAQGFRPNQMYEIVAPTGARHVPPAGNCWKLVRASFDELLADNRVYFGKDGTGVPRRKDFLSEAIGLVPWTWWPHEETGHTDEALKNVTDLFAGSASANTPKPIRLLTRIQTIATEATSTDVVVDYFAGSGTTAHAVLDLNAQDKGNRRFILVEAGDHFDTVLKPRVAKLMHAREWKDGVPVAREGTVGMVQVLRLESYDDTLDNLESVLSSDKQAALFDTDNRPTQFGREFMLRYMLEHTTEGSPSLLDARALERPFDRTLRVSLNGAETRTVDVVETFHWLIGMTVTGRKRWSTPAIHVSRGTLPNEQRVVTIWRDSTVSLEALHTWFAGELLATLADVDVVYINGDENLRRFRPEGHRWEVRHSHHEFGQRMFAGAE
ncbi:MAG: site-specific DNA-methyltransferase [Polyangiales bacterium]